MEYMEGDQAPCVGLVWKNQLWDFSNFDNSCERKEKLDHMKPINQTARNEGKAMVNKKRSRKIVTRSETNKTNGEDVKDGKSKHEAHILIEREKRKKMRNMFASLHGLLPHLSSKADKCAIVDEAVNHIKTLQQTLKKLQKQKQEMLQSISPLRRKSSVANLQWPPYDSNETFIVDRHGSSNNNSSTAMVSSSAPHLPVAFQTWSTPNLVLNICENEAQFCIYATKKPSLLATIALVLQIHNIDIVSANILCKDNGNAYMIQIHVKQASHNFQDTNSTRETYMQAAGEIAKWVV